jgi:hypothetical protein
MSHHTSLPTGYVSLHVYKYQISVQCPIALQINNYLCLTKLYDNPCEMSFQQFWPKVNLHCHVTTAESEILVKKTVLCCKGPRM